MPYFIDVTAKWCITCQTNKLTVLNRQIIKTAFKEKNLTLIQADWTNYDDSITELLKKHNQVSIPTYIFYNGSEYKVINDIITVKDIKRMIEK